MHSAARYPPQKLSSCAAALAVHLLAVVSGAVVVQSCLYTSVTRHHKHCRFQAQQDAVNLLAGAKTQANPESTVGSNVLLGCWEHSIAVRWQPLCSSVFAAQPVKQQ